VLSICGQQHILLASYNQEYEAPILVINSQHNLQPKFNQEEKTYRNILTITDTAIKYEIQQKPTISKLSMLRTILQGIVVPSRCIMSLCITPVAFLMPVCHVAFDVLDIIIINYKNYKYPVYATLNEYLYYFPNIMIDRILFFYKMLW
jgi:hypothetical protein